MNRARFKHDSRMVRWIYKLGIFHPSTSLYQATEEYTSLYMISRRDHDEPPKARCAGVPPATA